MGSDHGDGQVAVLPAPDADVDGVGTGEDGNDGAVVLQHEAERDPEVVSVAMTEVMFEVLKGTDEVTADKILDALRGSSQVGYATQVVEGAKGAASSLQEIVRDVVGYKALLAIARVDDLKLFVRGKLRGLLTANEDELRSSAEMHKALGGSSFARETFADDRKSRAFGLSEVATITDDASAIIKLRIKRIAEAFARSGIPEDLKRRYPYLRGVSLTGNVGGSGVSLLLQVVVTETKGRANHAGRRFPPDEISRNIIVAAQQKAQIVADDVLQRLHDNQLRELKFHKDEMAYDEGGSSNIVNPSQDPSVVGFQIAIL